MSLTYTKYLQVDELLKLQQPLSDDPEHDEMLFIITHQVYELWFKQIIHELSDFQSSLEKQNLLIAMRNLKRVLHILKVLVAQMDIIETLSPLSFRAFRDRLENSSGFQSAQFREIEFMLGRRNPTVLVHYPEGEEESLLTQLCEHLIDLDEGLQEWRYRHIKMVERTIGNKIGSGGSSGVDYLYKTLLAPLFPDLWAIRNKL
jgi:tryptophan 2,3-dioxygenase